MKFLNDEMNGWILQKLAQTRPSDKVCLDHEADRAVTALWRSVSSVTDGT